MEPCDKISVIQMIREDMGNTDDNKAADNSPILYYC